MPCMDLFEEQSQEYRDEVLPPAVRTRLAVEPGATISWGKWVGLDGDVVGLDRFGASAPGTKVLEELGFTVENIAARAAVLLERKG
jgi:transketolase